MVRLSFAVTASILLFWISAMGSSNYLLYTWRSGTKALSPHVLELLLWSRASHVRQRHEYMSSKIATIEQAVISTEQAVVENRTPGVMSSVLGVGVAVSGGAGDGVQDTALYRKRALALRRASGNAARVLVAPEDLSAKDILPDGHNGFTSMIAISCVFVFATFVAF